MFMLHVMLNWETKSIHLNQSKSSNDPTQFYERSCQITFTLMQNLSLQHVSIQFIPSLNVCSGCTPVSISTSHEATRKATSLHRSCLGCHKIYNHFFSWRFWNVVKTKSSNSSCKHQLQNSCCSFIFFGNFSSYFLEELSNWDLGPT